MLESDLSPANDSTVFLKDYQPPDYLVKKVQLDFQLSEKQTEVSARLELSKNGDHDRSLFLNGEKLQLQELQLNGRVLDSSDYELNSNGLHITEMPAHSVLEIRTLLQPHLNTELSGLYQSGGNYCTQCEAEGFRRITFFPDRPDVLAEYEVSVTADQKQYPVLLSNGNRVAQGKNEDGTHWAKWHDPHPKPSYLFALVAGDLQSISGQFETKSGNPVELNIYTEAHNIEKCEHALTSLRASMEWDEKVYGREYDLDIYNIVAVDDFNMGAMENKGLNIFNSKYVLANQQSATDSDYEGIESVIGHEYFHNWSGNRVTCRDWFQLSLKEGFTVFRDQEFSADMGSREVKRIRDVQVLRAHQFKEDAGPMAHPVRPSSYQEINNFYTVTIYEKGAEIIRMLRSIVGNDGFRAGTDLYFDRFDGKAVTTEDFVQCMEEVNKVDLKQFRLWYTQAGTPRVTVDQHYDANRKVFSLEFTQSCPATPGQTDKANFYLPISLALLNSTGKEIHSQILLLDKSHYRVEFPNWEEAPVVSLLRGFSSPVIVKFNQRNQELAHLIRHDNDGFARWEAMQRLFLNLLLPAIRSGNFDEQVYQQLLSALAGLLDNPPQDRAILAEMLSLPGSAYIAERSKPIHPKNVFEKRRILKSRLADDLQSRLEKVYQDNQSNSFSLDAKSMAKRALKNCALGYLVACEQPEFYTLAQNQYYSADNMTDRLAAFSTLIHSTFADKQALIDHFYDQWRDDKLVMDKWFAMQATVPDRKALQRVLSLQSHPGFSITNPNKVRSLIGAYTANMPSFHHEDGTGYRFLADKIIELNSINPQIAARLSTVFNNWKSYVEPQLGLMKTELERIADTPDLSRDIKEIVTKALR